MFGWLRKCGLDARFIVFVLVTMLGSSVIGGIAVGVSAYILTGSSELLLVAPFLAVIAGGFLVPIAFVVWLVPSALTFAVTFSLFRRLLLPKCAAQWAGITTVTVAAIALTSVVTAFGQDWDGLGAAMLFIGPAAILISPFVAGYIYD